MPLKHGSPATMVAKTILEILGPQTWKAGGKKTWGAWFQTRKCGITEEFAAHLDVLNMG